jgi:hypothetical protein
VGFREDVSRDTAPGEREEPKMRSNEEVKQLIADRYGRFAETGGTRDSC